MKMRKYIEIPLDITFEYEKPEPDVMFRGGVYIDDVEIDGESIFYGDVAKAILKRYRDIEIEIEEDAEELVKTGEYYES